MSQFELNAEKRNIIVEICQQYDNRPSDVIHVLHGVQGALGYLPKEVQEAVAKQLGIPASRVYGIVSFYSFFTMEPKGEHPISICLGTACHVRGANQILEEFQRHLGIGVGQTTPDGKFSIDCLRCVGACGLAPVAMIGEKVYGRLTPSQIPGIIAEYQN